MRILALGDAMVDRYIVGRTTRTNPEGNWPLVTVDQILEFPGGATNVAENLSKLGADVTLLSGNIDAAIFKTRVVLDSRTICRIDEDATYLPICKKYVHGRSSLEYYSKDPPWDAVVISDYGKGSVDDELAEWIRGLAKPTFVDCKVRPDRWAGWVDAMLPNVAEYAAHEKVYYRTHVLIIKRGALGADVLVEGRPLLTAPSLANVRKVQNVAGAGDTVVAAFVVAALAHGKPLQLRDTLNSCLRFAMKAAALAVEQPYTHAPTLDEIEKAFGITETEIRIRKALHAVEAQR